MDRAKRILYLIWIQYAVYLSVCYAGQRKTFRELYSRTANQRLSASAAGQSRNVSLEKCAEKCTKQSGYRCKSFDYISRTKLCVFFTVNAEDNDVGLIAKPGTDHYQTNYRSLFNRLPNHRLSRTYNRKVEQVSVEECARRCVLETYFKCRAFDYREIGNLCWMTELTLSTSQGIEIYHGMNHYSREVEGPLKSFINYGMGILRPMQTSEVYQKSTMGMRLEACASSCLQEKTFHCVSFDYIMKGALSVCHLSKYLAANVYGLTTSYNERTVHMERIDKYLEYFYATPYAVILGNNQKTFTQVTPNRCARNCMEEEGFVCRSFDYKIKEGKCLLSGKTGSDVGGLYNQGLSEVHHFEMKPLMDCGGNLTSYTGNFASPNWPRKYASNEYCVWYIEVAPFRVIHLWFTHFDLGLRNSDPCKEGQDRLIITEVVQGRENSFCVMPNTRRIVSHSNKLTVRFQTRDHSDGQGFRVFYTAEWTCGVLLNKVPTGEFATPKWPDKYPPSTQCSWRITAPKYHRVKVYFTSFKLEQHDLGHCNDKYDHVAIKDGGTVSAPRIGFYCGEKEKFTVRSSGRDMFVQFSSDGFHEQAGFHARYEFEVVNKTLIPVKPKKKSKDRKRLRNEKEKSNNGSSVEANKDRQAYSSGQLGANHSALWAITVCLLLLVILMIVVLFLVWRYYRRKLRKYKREAREGSIEPEEVPLQESSNLADVHPCIKPNNVSHNRPASPPPPPPTQDPGTSFNNPLFGPKESNLNKISKLPDNNEAAPPTINVNEYGHDAACAEKCIDK